MFLTNSRAAAFSLFLLAVFLKEKTLQRHAPGLGCCRCDRAVSAQVQTLPLGSDETEELSPVLGGPRDPHWTRGEHGVGVSGVHQPQQPFLQWGEARGALGWAQCVHMAPELR